MNEQIAAAAARELKALRRARGLQPRAPHSLGLILPPTPGVPLPDGEPSHLLPVPLEEWAAQDHPWDWDEPPPAP